MRARRRARARTQARAFALAIAGCPLVHGGEGVAQRDAAAPQARVNLPAPRHTGSVSVEDALLRRRSVRTFARVPLRADELGQLLWAAQGITDAQGLRTAPSAGALYPLECYVVTADATFRYVPRDHRLERHVAADLRRALGAAALGQGAVADAPAVVVITATYARTARKYGDERARRYAVLEAGHAAQNVLLQAVAMGLGAVPIGAFDDDRVAELLRLRPGEEPLYLVPVGHAAP